MVLIFRGWVNLRAHGYVRRKYGKNPQWQPGIDHGTFRLVAQRLKHYATPGPECVFVTVIIRRAKRMRHIILSSGACLSVLYFFPHLIKGKIFEKKKFWTWNMFRFPLQLLSKTFFILRRIQRDIIINVHKYSCQILMKLEYSRRIF